MASLYKQIGEIFGYKLGNTFHKFKKTSHGKNESIIPYGHAVRWHTHPFNKTNGYTPNPSKQNIKSILKNTSHGQKQHIIFTPRKTYIITPPSKTNSINVSNYNSFSNNWRNYLQKKGIKVNVKKPYLNKIYKKGPIRIKL